MQIEKVKISELIPYVRNSRTHSEEQIIKIVSSMREFGFTNPVLISESNDIIAGHGRILAAKKLDMQEVPCIRLSHLTDAQRKAYVIADNRLALDAGWDEELLKLELQELNIEHGFDLSLTGFDKSELDDLLIDLDGQDDVAEDDYEEPNDIDHSHIKPGMIWRMGDHRLMCGDSTSEEMASELMAGEKADMVFTDPPYGVEYQSNWRTKSKKFEVIKNDDKELDIVPVIENNSVGWVFIWTTWKVINKWIDKTVALGYPSNMVIWFKGGGGIGDLKKTFSTDYEVALVFNRGAELCGKRIGSVWTINNDGASTYIHPTQKPISLAAEAIDKTTNINDSVLDLFGGSGSTLIACEQTSRKCYMMELDPKYVATIVDRWEKFTGQKAELITSGG